MLRDRRTGVMWSVHENTQLKAHLQHFFRRNIRLILDPWIQILNQGREEGVFRALDPQLSALSLLSMLNSTVLYQMHFRGDVQDDRSRRACLQLVCAGRAPNIAPCSYISLSNLKTFELGIQHAQFGQ